MPLISGKSPDTFKKNIKTEMDSGRPLKQSLAIAYAMKRKAKKMAEGGFVSDNYQDDEDEMDMVGQIMKQKEQHLSEGGMVANSDKPEADFEPNEFDDLHLRDDLEFSETEKNSGDDLSDSQENHDREDMISEIMKQRSLKDRLPRTR